MPRPIPTKFSAKYYCVLVHWGSKFELDKSKFAQVRQLKANFRKIQNLKESDREPELSILAQFNTKRKVRAGVLQKIKSLIKFQIGISDLHENRHDRRGVTCSLVYQISTRYLKQFISYSGLKS